MGTFLTVLFVTLGIVLYLIVGAIIGWVSMRVWTESIDRGVVPFLLFPVNFVNGTVGDSGSPYINLCAIVDDSSVELLPLVYWGMMLLVWPLRVAFLVPVIVVLGLYLGVRFIVYWCYDAHRNRKEERNKKIMAANCLTPSDTDDLETLAEKCKRLNSEIGRLARLRDEADNLMAQRLRALASNRVIVANGSTDTDQSDE